MLKLNTLETDHPVLQDHPWPPVPAFSAIAPELRRFLDADMAGREQTLRGLRRDHEAHGKLIHDGLGLIYAYVYGYADSPCHNKADAALELKLLAAKLALEDELIEHWLRPRPVPRIRDQQSAIDYLHDFVGSNSGVYHPLFDYLRDHATDHMAAEFLRLEVCRNEVVDDEVALLVCGLQGSMKKVMASNLWDECGNGRLSRFHTYWLRRLINELGDWEHLHVYRETTKPWFSSITSNSFNSLVTRPGYKLRGYGSFLATEAWVQPHFERIVAALARVGLDHEDLTVYFQAHLEIDPHHTAEMLEGLEYQVPRLSVTELTEVIRGAHQAEAAGVALYERVLPHLRDLPRST